MSTGTPDELESLVQRGIALASEGRLEEADAVFDAVEALDAGHAALHHHRGTRAIQRQDFETGEGHFRKVLEREPTNVVAEYGLAMAFYAQQKFEEALGALDRALAVDPDQPHCWLYRGVMLEGLQRNEEAVRSYMKGLGGMDRLGWQATDPRTETLVRHANLAAAVELDRRFDEALRSLVEEHGAAAVRRIREGADIFVGKRSPESVDPRQKPGLFHVPGLPPQPWFDRAAFAWVSALEEATVAICEEMTAVVSGSEDVHLYRNGEPVTDILDRCPRTAALLEALPLHGVPGYSPQVLFSTLPPKGRIESRYGPVNGRTIVHLPLVVPPGGCTLTVGGEGRTWMEGEALVFDDSFAHEAVNDTDSPQVILAFDIWNPDLSAVEQEAFSRVLQAARSFERESFD